MFRTTEFDEFTSRAIGRLTTWYDRVNLRFSRALVCCDAFRVGAYADAHYLYIGNRRSANYGFVNSAADPARAAFHRNRFSGGGISVGMQASCAVWRCFGLLAKGGAGATIGRRTYFLRQKGFNATDGAYEDFRQNVSDRWGIVPNLDLCVALSAETCLNCCRCAVKIRGEIGYEFAYYYHALELSDASGLSFGEGQVDDYRYALNPRDVGLMGPFAALKLCF